MIKKLNKISIMFLGIGAFIAGAAEAAESDYDICIEEKEKTNFIGQELWESKTPDQVQKEETIDYNRGHFESLLSQIGWTMYNKLTCEEKRMAMKIADKSQFSPDAAVFLLSKEF